MEPNPKSLSHLHLSPPEHPIDYAFVQEVDRRTEWMAQRLGVMGPNRMPVERFRAGRFGLLTALAYPEAEIDDAALCNDFNTYLFYVDDQAEEDEAYGKQPSLLAAYFQGHVMALRTGHGAWEEDPGTRLLKSVRRRLGLRASDQWIQRFADCVEEYLLRGTLVGAQHWTDGSVPEIADYEAQRAWDSAVYCSQLLAEIACGHELSGSLRGNDLLKRTETLVTRVVAFTNDLVSYTKEVVRNQSPNNLVYVHMVHGGCSLESAIDVVIDVINADLAEFETLSATLARTFPDEPGLASYQACQRSWMSGNLAWSLASGRYLDPDSPFPELRPVQEAIAG